MPALRSERVMIFAGPFSPRFTADTFVVSENVGEGGPGEAWRFPCEFVDIAKGLWGRDFSMWERMCFTALDGWVGGDEEWEREGRCVDYFQPSVVLLEDCPLEAVSLELSLRFRALRSERIWSSPPKTGRLSIAMGNRSSNVVVVHTVIYH